MPHQDMGGNPDEFQFRFLRRGVDGRRKGMPRKTGFVRSLGSRHPITKGPPAAAACGGLRPDRPNTGGAGNEKWLNRRKQDLEAG